MATRTGPVRAVAGSNFEPKRVRKARRKALLRGVIPNAMANARAGMDDRAEFYRNLRMIKLRRRHVAREMGRLSLMVRGLTDEIKHVENRYPDAMGSVLDEAKGLVKSAYTSVSVASDEFGMFARNRVFYIKEL